MGPQRCRRRDLGCVPCASSTPPTGTSGRSFHREGMLGAPGGVRRPPDRGRRARDGRPGRGSGDVYDRALPQVDAVALADETFSPAGRESRARLVVTSGNHDSAQRLGFGSRLIDAAGVFIRTDAATVGTPVLLDDQHGKVAVYGIPYLEPDTLREPWGLRGAFARGGARAPRCSASAPTSPRRTGSTRSVVLAHAFVAGGEPSESERDISVGGVSMVSSQSLRRRRLRRAGPPARPAQEVTDRIRYSGSPLAYSFSEADQVKGSWLVDLDGDGDGDGGVRRGAGPATLARLRGELEALLADPRHEPARGVVRPGHPHRRRPPARRRWSGCGRRFPHTLVLSLRADGRRRATTAPRHRPQGQGDHAIALDFVRELRGTPATDGGGRPPPARPSTRAATTATRTCS